MNDPVDTVRSTPATRTVLSKVPEATLCFWIIKIVTTGMGEIVADDFAERLGLVWTAVIMGPLTAVALVWQFRQTRYRAWPYWTAAAMVSVFGTTVGDGPRRWLGLSFEFTSIVLGIVVLLVLAAWYATEKTVSIHSITNRRREGFYWSTVGMTFALGTAVGDLATHLGSGFIQSSAVFLAAMVVFYLAHRYLHLNGIFAFWSAYILTRPLGASMADWTWVPKPYGAGLGKDLTGAISIAVFLAVLVYMAATHNGEPRVDEPRHDETVAA